MLGTRDCSRAGHMESNVPKVSLGRWEGRAVCLPVKTGDKSGDKSDNDWCRRPIRSNRDIWATR